MCMCVSNTYGIIIHVVSELGKRTFGLGRGGGKMLYLIFTRYLAPRDSAWPCVSFTLIAAPLGRRRIKKKKQTNDIIIERQ